METRKVLRQAVGASAAVVLAAVVNAAVASPVAAQSLSAASSRQAALGADLSWAISGASVAQNTRSILAEKAAEAIHSLDVISGAALQSLVTIDFQPPVSDCIVRIQPAALRHTESSHQYSAP